MRRPHPSVRQSIYPSLCQSVTYDQRLNRLSDYHETWYKSCLQKVAEEARIS